MNALVPQQKLMLLASMADQYLLQPDEFSKTVRATCGLVAATPEQFAAFLIVAKTYGLNPLTKEVYAFPGKGGGIVPIVSIDGWVNLVNSHPQCDGFEFQAEHVDGKLFSFTCIMHRKDRKFPTTVTEYLSECIRSTEPWKMQHRMLRHKSLIQAARYAFGFAGIYDEDEGRTIAEATDITPRPRVPSPSEMIEHQLEHPLNGSEKPGSEISGDPVDDMPDAGDKTSEPATVTEPHCIVGENYTAKTWADAYIAALQTATDTATAFKWVDANAVQLKKLSRAEFNRVEKASAAHMDSLRGIDPISTGKPKTKKAPDFAKDYDGWMTHKLEAISKATSVDDLEEIFAAVDAVWEDLMPPDKTSLSEARSAAEDRLAP